MRITVNQSQGGVRGMKRRFNQSVKVALLVAVETWHERQMPDHFTVAGGKKYGYQPRKGDNEAGKIPLRDVRGNTATLRSVSNWHYSWRKRRQKGHNKPLVWSGDSEKAAKQGIRLSARTVAAEQVTRGIGVMDLPKYFYMYRKDTGAPDKVDELTRVTPDEERELAHVFEQSLTTSMAAPGGAVGAMAALATG